MVEKKVTLKGWLFQNPEQEIRPSPHQSCEDPKWHKNVNHRRFPRPRSFGFYLLNVVPVCPLPTYCPALAQAPPLLT